MSHCNWRNSDLKVIGYELQKELSITALWLVNRVRELELTVNSTRWAVAGITFGALNQAFARQYWIRRQHFCLYWFVFSEPK